MAGKWEQNIIRLSKLLREVSVRDSWGNEIGYDVGMERWKEMTRETRSMNNEIFLVGNGASASMASHFAADISKNAGIRTQTFSDSALMTALANDLSYEVVYSEPIKWCMKKSDMLVAISSSGNSPNIVRAGEMAKKIGGAVITLSAMKRHNTLQKIGDLNFYVSAQTYGLAETAHAAILHYWVDGVIEDWQKTYYC